MDDTTTTRLPRSLAPIAFWLGLAGFLPIPGLIASIAALVCGRVAMSDATSDADRAQARLGLVFGLIGVLLPLTFFFVYCVILGYPFPIRRYQPEQ